MRCGCPTAWLSRSSIRAQDSRPRRSPLNGNASKRVGLMRGDRLAVTPFGLRYLDSVVSEFL